jgi:hypothetical protein
MIVVSGFHCHGNRDASFVTGVSARRARTSAMLGLRIDVIELGRRDQRRHEGSPVGAAIRARAVLTRSDDDTFAGNGFLDGRFRSKALAVDDRATRAGSR